MRKLEVEFNCARKEEVFDHKVCAELPMDF